MFHDDPERFAAAVLGEVDLRDSRLRTRAVSLLADLCRRPAGTVTGAFLSPAQREAAYRFLQNDRVPAAAISSAVFSATARSAQGLEYVYVPIDGSSITLTDRLHARDVGLVGSRSNGARGLIVVSALVVQPDGVPLGLASQRFWARPSTRKKPRNKHVRGGPESELRRSLEVMEETVGVLKAHAEHTKPWFQLDRLYDARLMLEQMGRTDAWITVRGRVPRRLESTGKRRAYSDQRIRQQQPWGHHTAEVRARSGRGWRTAVLEVRVLKTVVSMRGRGKHSAPRSMQQVTYVDVREPGRDGLHWTLLTNYPVETLADARRVVDGYTTRWRIEDFHRAWKSGHCNVEDTQLRSREGLIKWATLQAAVATRATRLTYLARERPEAPAATEFTPDELLVAVALSGGNRSDIETLTLGEAVRIVATLGGYTGKSSGGPPGVTVVGRGLREVASVARGLREVRALELRHRKL